MSQLNSHQRGVLITVVGVLVLTPDALVVRLIETDHWTLLFWRSLFAAICLFALNAFIEKSGPIKAIGGLFKIGLFCALLFAGSNVCFVISITHTAVANTLVILASTPFVAAVLSVVLMQKKLALRTWVTIFIAMAGIVMVFWGRIGDGNAFGDVFALLCALFLAAALVSVSLNPKINSTAAIGLGSFLAALFLVGRTPAPSTGTKASSYHALPIDVGHLIAIPSEKGLGGAHFSTKRKFAFRQPITSIFLELSR